jgi:urea transport system permease protein
MTRLAAALKRLEGPQTLGRGRGFWSGFAVVLVVALLYPLTADSYDVGNVAYFLVWIFMALGLCLQWGYTGMLSFGQTAFFGVAGYAYGVLSINLGDQYGLTLVALAAALALAAAFAAVLGYFMIYGRIGGVFFGIVTLSVTFAIAAFLAQTAGPEWAIGRARLNGYNGMKGMPPLTVPWFGGDVYLEETVLYYVLVGLLVIVYLALRMLVNSRFGNVLVAIREDPQRAELLGYDIRKYQLGSFVIGSALAALSGVLYTSWGQFITPATMALPAAAMPIIWVAFGGRQDLTATTVGTFAILAIFQAITIYSQQYALILMGLLLLVTVLFVPAGYVVALARLGGRAARRLRRARAAVGGAPAAAGGAE